MKRKVLYTASTYSHIAYFHRPYLRMFHEMGWLVHVSCGSQELPIPEADAVYHLPFQKRMTAPANLKAARLLSAIMAENQYDLVCTHTSLAAFFTRLALPLHHRPKVINMVHGYLFDDSTPFLKKQILLGAEKCMASRTDLLITMNDWDDRAARQYRLGREFAKVPGIGVDFSRFQPTQAQGSSLRAQFGIPSDAFVLIYAAEFSARKNQAALLQAMAALPEQVVLCLPGDGDLLPECKRMADHLNLSGRVIFPGRVSDLTPWYAAADAAVSASRSEGLPFNIMEAMYCRLPIVASRVKGHTDLVLHGETGFLYPYGDAAALAEHIRFLFADRSAALAFGESAHQTVQAFSLEHVLPEVMRWYTHFF